MATVVEDLVVRLGFQTPGAGAAEKSIRAIRGAAQGLTGIGSSVTSFFSGLKKEFKSGWSEGWSQGLKENSRNLKSLGDQAEQAKAPIEHLRGAFQALMALAVVGWVRQQGQELMTLGSVLSNTASELHTSATVVQELGYAAKSVDLDVGDLTGALRVLTRQIEAARGGSKEAAEKFRELGLSAEMLAKMPVDEQLAATADALLKIEDPSKRAAIQMQLFGRSGGKLAALLEQGSGGLAQLREDFRALGGGLSQDAIDALGESEQSLKKLDVSILSFKSHLVLLVGPAITKLIDGVRGVFQWLAKADKQMHILQAGGIAALIYGLTKIGTAIKWLTGLSTMFTAANAAIIGMTLLIVALAIVLQDLYNGFTGGRSAIFEWLAAWGGIEPLEKTLRSVKDLISGITAGLEEIRNKGLFSALGDALGTENVKSKNEAKQQASEETFQSMLDKANELPNGSEAKSNMIKAAMRLRNQNIDSRFGVDAPRAAQGLAGARDFGFDTSHISPDILDPSGAGAVSASADVTVNVTNSNASPEDIAAATKAGTKDGIDQAARKLAAAAGKK